MQCFMDVKIVCVIRLAEFQFSLFCFCWQNSTIQWIGNIVGKANEQASKRAHIYAHK